MTKKYEIHATGTLGEYPGGDTSWWTAEDWEKWSRQREGYIFSGEFGKPWENDVTFHFKQLPAISDARPTGDGLFSNFAILIPQGVERYPDGTPRKHFGENYGRFTWEEIEKEYRYMTSTGPVFGEWHHRGITCDWDTDKHLFEKYAIKYDKEGNKIPPPEPCTYKVSEDNPNLFHWNNTIH